MSDKRLLFLEQTVAAGSTEPLALYGLAQEYRSRKRNAEALATFEKLRAAHPDYVALYLMAGQMLAEEEKPALAIEWLEAGMIAAKKVGNSHALSELSSLRNSL
jgi:predicted Zn-dependent protease